MKRWLVILAFPLVCLGAKEIELTKDATVETGFHFQILLPNILPGFPRSLGVFGPYVGFPIGNQAIELQGFYGKSEEQSASLIETAFRHNFRTPFFTAHVVVGPHFIKTTFGSEEHSHLGGHLGFGFDVPFSKTFEVGVGTKLYVQSRNILAFFGGFGLLL